MKYLFVFFVSILCSCNSQKGKISYQQSSSKLPVKILFTDNNINDSIMIGLFIPQKFDVNNNDIFNVKISSIRHSLKGGNVYGTNGTEIYHIEEDTLVIAAGKIKLYSFQEKEKDIYVGY